MKKKLEYKGNNVVGTLMNIPIFVGTFSILTDFAVLEDMAAYHDERMGDVIFGEPFLREVRINAKWFERKITIHNASVEARISLIKLEFSSCIFPGSLINLLRVSFIDFLLSWYEGFALFL
uniref:Uncharacterized protein n=1 Tax=Tanacetum cinerariifolium TaxID=118510 RepID=A0A699JBX4_TANCI|nr:hypothetical protein [Tanacetum cinerariifolium]